MINLNYSLGLINDKGILKFGGNVMEPIIVKKEKFKVAGYSIDTNISGAEHTSDVAAFWSEFDTNGWENKLYKQLNPPKHGEVGMIVPSGNRELVKYILGVIVDDFSKTTKDMTLIEVPEAIYAVFTTPPVDYSEDNENAEEDFVKSIKGTWKYIFNEWFTNSGYEYNDSKMDFEFYDERCHFRKDTVMEIYVPVKS